MRRLFILRQKGRLFKTVIAKTPIKKAYRRYFSRKQVLLQICQPQHRSNLLVFLCNITQNPNKV